MPRRSPEKELLAPCCGGVGRRDQRWHARPRSCPRAAGTAFPEATEAPPAPSAPVLPKTTAPSVTVSLPGGSGPAPPLGKCLRRSPVPPYCAFRAVPQVPGLAEERLGRAGPAPGAPLRPP